MERDPVVAEIALPLRPVRVLGQARGFAPLRQFSCGRQGKPWESSVNRWVKELSRGLVTDETVVVLEDAAHKLVGIGSFKPQLIVAVDVSVGKNAQRIHMMAIDRLYRGSRLDDGLRLGDILLRGVFEQIQLACGGILPAVSALVAPENGPSHALFDRQGFGRMPYAGEGEVIRVRPPDKRLSLVRLKLMRELA